MLEKTAHDTMLKAMTTSNVSSRYHPHINTKLVSKFLLAGSFSLISVVVLGQFMTYPVNNTFSSSLAYVAFPLLLFSIFLAVYMFSYTPIRQAWRENRRLKWFSWIAGVIYASSYIFATNIIQIPEQIYVSGLLRLWSHTGYVMAIDPSVYSPFTGWFGFDFYIPQLNLEGTINVGTILLVSSLMLLTTFAVTLAAQSFIMRRRVAKSVVGIGNQRAVSSSFAGALLSVLSTNNCCCCTPVLFPAIATLFGGGGSAASFLVNYLISPTSPVTSLLVTINLVSLILSILFSAAAITRRERKGKSYQLICKTFVIPKT